MNICSTTYTAAKWLYNDQIKKIKFVSASFPSTYMQAYILHSHIFISKHYKTRPVARIMGGGEAGVGPEKVDIFDLKKWILWTSPHTLLLNKAVLVPRVSPAFASTYFCNHCNIRFENTSKYVDTLILFSKNLNQRSLTPAWPLTPCLLRSHVWLYPRIIVSKSHDNTSMYVDTVINFANYHIHTYTYYIHTTYILRTYYVQNEWSHSLLLNSVQVRQKKP